MRRSNLTLTLALRADHQSNPVCESRCFVRLSGPFNSISHDPDQPYNEAILMNQKQAFPNTDSIVWSPRFSFAWQPLGVSRTIRYYAVALGSFTTRSPVASGHLCLQPTVLQRFHYHWLQSRSR